MNGAPALPWYRLVMLIIVDVNLEDTPQADALVGEVRFFNSETNAYDPASAALLD